MGDLFANLKPFKLAHGRGLLLYRWRFIAALLLIAGIQFMFSPFAVFRAGALDSTGCECNNKRISSAVEEGKSLASESIEIQDSEAVDPVAPVQTPSILPYSTESEILQDPEIYLPQPCYKGMDDVFHKNDDLSKWPVAEIDKKRLEWQTWYTDDMPKIPMTKYSATMEKIDSVLRAQGVIGKSDSYRSSSTNFPRNRGIVVTISHVRQLTYLTAQVELLRSQGCKLPIEVWGFPHEMNDDMRQSINNLAQPDMPVILRLADENLPWPISRGKTDGYHIKAVAILNSAFWEVLYLDVDVMPMKNPEELFDSVEYIKYGTIFWVDYWKTHPYSPVWRWLGLPCMDEWEQESGILVIDRARVWNALRLLWYFERDDDIRRFHGFLHGDKDLFRFSWKITNTPVYWVPHWVSPGGFLPNPKHPDRHCGISMIQFDPKGVPTFAHVNFFKQTNMVNFTHASPMLTHIKRYKTPPLDEFQFPPGPFPGKKMRWGHTRGHRAGFVGIDQFVCVSLGSAEGMKLETEVVPIANWHPTFQDDLFKLLGKELVDKARKLKGLPPVE